MEVSVKQHKKIYTFIINIIYALKPEKCFANDNESDVLRCLKISQTFS